MPDLPKDDQNLDKPLGQSPTVGDLPKSGPVDSQASEPGTISGTNKPSVPIIKPEEVDSSAQGQQLPEASVPPPNPDLPEINSSSDGLGVDKPAVAESKFTPPGGVSPIPESEWFRCRC